MRTVQVGDTLRRLMTRGDVARYLGVHVSTVRRLEGIELHPQRLGNAYVFESAEVEALGRKRGMRAPGVGMLKEGELAARAFEAFDANVPFREIVKQLKIAPEKVKAWYLEWRTPIEEAYARVEAEKKAALAAKRQRIEERRMLAARVQDKHDLKKFEKEMAVINRTLKGGKK